MDMRWFDVSAVVSFSTAAKFMMLFTSASNGLMVVRELHMEQVGVTTSENWQIEFLASTSAGTGGGSNTPRAKDAGQAAFDGTVADGSTIWTVNPAGSDPLGPGDRVMNSFGGMDWVPADDQGAILLHNGDRLGINLASAPGASGTMYISAVVAEALGVA